MYTIILVGWYCIEGLTIQHAIEALEKIGIKTVFFPFASYIDPFPLDPYHFKYKSHPCHIKHHNAIAQFMYESCPDADAILFWNWPKCEPIYADCRRLFPGKTTFIMLNRDIWDPQVCPTILCHMDAVFAAAANNMPKEHFHGVIYKQLYPGFSPRSHHPGKDDDMMCDVSFVATQLYQDHEKYPNQFIDRKQMVIDLEKSDLVFHLYGPPYLGEICPTSYKRHIPFEESRKVFCSAEVAISIHGDYTVEKGFNERVITVLASGGLLLVDPVYGMEEVLQNGIHCIYMDKRPIVDQIKDILALPEKTRDQIRKNGYEYAMSHWTFDHWARDIEEAVKYEPHRPIPSYTRYTHEMKDDALCGYICSGVTGQYISGDGKPSPVTRQMRAVLGSSKRCTFTKTEVLSGFTQGYISFSEKQYLHSHKFSHEDSKENRYEVTIFGDLNRGSLWNVVPFSYEHLQESNTQNSHFLLENEDTNGYLGIETMEDGSTILVVYAPGTIIKDEMTFVCKKV
jgi:hypothetical protein